MSNTKSLAVSENVMCEVALWVVCCPSIMTRKCGGYINFLPPPPPDTTKHYTTCLTHNTFNNHLLRKGYALLKCFSLLIAIKKIIVFAAVSSLWPSRAPVHTYNIMYHVIRNRYCMHHCASNIIIYVKNTRSCYILHSITITAKSSKKMKGDK